MDQRQLLEQGKMCEFDGKNRDGAVGKMGSDQRCRRVDLSRPVFDRAFPQRGDARIKLVVAALETPARLRPETRIIAEPPQQDLRESGRGSGRGKRGQYV